MSSPTSNNPNPLTPEEFQKLLHALDLTCQNVERLLNQGVIVTEALDDELVTLSREKIERYHDQIRREQLRISRIKAIIARRKEAESRRKE